MGLQESGVEGSAESSQGFLDPSTQAAWLGGSVAADTACAAEVTGISSASSGAHPRTTSGSGSITGCGAAGAGAAARGTPQAGVEGLGGSSGQSRGTPPMVRAPSVGPAWGEAWFRAAASPVASTGSAGAPAGNSGFLPVEKNTPFCSNVSSCNPKVWLQAELAADPHAVRRPAQDETSSCHSRHILSPYNRPYHQKRVQIRLITRVYGRQPGRASPVPGKPSS